MGPTVERLEITQRRENIRARNYVSGPEIPPQDRKFRPRAGISAPGQNFWGRKLHNFWPFEIRLSPLWNVVVQRAVRGPEILVWQNFRGPEIMNSAKSLPKGCGATL
jgi:hypothetical protein